MTVLQNSYCLAQGCVMQDIVAPCALLPGMQILMQLGRLLKDTGRFQRAAEVYRAVTLLEVHL